MLVGRNDFKSNYLSSNNFPTQKKIEPSKTNTLMMLQAETVRLQPFNERL